MFTCMNLRPSAKFPPLDEYLASSFTASLSLSIAYGVQANTPDKKLIRLFEELLAGARRSAVPGASFVDLIRPREPDSLNLHVVVGPDARLDTAVRYLPSWFPGVEFHS